MFQLGWNLSCLTLCKAGKILLKSLFRMCGYMKNHPSSSGVQMISQSYPNDQAHSCWMQQTWKLTPSDGSTCLSSTRPIISHYFHVENSFRSPSSQNSLHGTHHGQVTIQAQCQNGCFGCTCHYTGSSHVNKGLCWWLASCLPSTNCTT